jgi:hypothetical protein
MKARPMASITLKNFCNAFWKHGWIGYRQMEDSLCSIIDKDRARNEIALVNTDTKAVTYGIASIFILIGQSSPALQPLFKWKAFRAIMKKVYAFISYNRKVIAPGKQFEGYNQCTPDFNLTWRLIYIFLSWIVVSLILVHIQKL